MFLMPQHTWARLLTYVTGLVNQKLLLQNEYLAAENRILRAHLPARRIGFSEPTFPPVSAFLIPSDRPSLKSAGGSAGLPFSRSPMWPSQIPSSPGTAGSLHRIRRLQITYFTRPAPHRTRTGSA